MRPFQELAVWRKSHALTLAVYHQTRSFPADERFGLTSQLRRSSSSIGANVAEGSGRDRDREFAHFLRIAAGSAAETEYHLLLARDLDYLGVDPWQQLTNQTLEVQRMLAAFIRRLDEIPPLAASS